MFCLDEIEIERGVAELGWLGSNGTDTARESSILKHGKGKRKKEEENTASPFSCSLYGD